ncbi:cupin fold metalloprotein, WbuC family [Candidatus Woesearchaeota archaeon]|nr:cupin fold metalloprotein, WbuC family [Candidatus Woesearchaeota archaeon]
MNCRVCRQDVQEIMNLGQQPVSNRFLKNADEQEYTHNLSIGVCNACGLMQLTDTFPAAEIASKHDWLTYTEPERHLDELAKIISGLGSKVCAISYKDDSLLQRLKKLGLSGMRLDPVSDLGAGKSHNGVEVVQQLLNVQAAKQVAEKNGKFDIVLARHILEHAYNISEFMKSIKELLKPEGVAVLEVPDCTKAIEQLDYGMIWEEHLAYFTPAAFKSCIMSAGFAAERFETYQYLMENSLVAIAKPAEKKSIQNGEHEIEAAKKYAEAFAEKKKAAQEFMKSQKGNIAVFGAGHTASTLINLFELKDFVSFVADDNENKQGMLMPGSKLPIRSSDKLNEADLCILSVNPEAEKKIIVDKNFNGKWASFSPISELSIFNRFRKASDEVYYAQDRIADKKDIELIKAKAQRSTQKKSRLCMHSTEGDKLQEMLIVHGKGTYVRPHKHVNKAESFHVVEGTARVIVFDDNGKITKAFEIGDYESGKPFYCRMNDKHYHTLIITSDWLVFHESTTGPFNRADTITAPFAPKNDDEIAEFMKKTNADAEKFLRSHK